VALESIAAKTPLLLVLEDLQWVDHSTVDLIAALARRREPSRFMLLATHRAVIPLDHPLKAITQELITHQLSHEIDLQPFTQPEVAEFLTADSSRSDLPEGLAELVHRHTEGNPLFIVASVEHLTRRGFISREKGIWQIRVPLEEIDLGVPETLRQLIEAQIERLSAEEQRSLEAASVLGANLPRAPWPPIWISTILKTPARVLHGNRISCVMREIPAPIDPSNTSSRMRSIVKCSTKDKHHHVVREFIFVAASGSNPMTRQMRLTRRLSWHITSRKQGLGNAL
jgi:hypothetical protein